MYVFVPAQSVFETVSSTPIQTLCVFAYSRNYASNLKTLTNRGQVLDTSVQRIF